MSNKINKITITCHEKDCLESRTITWKGDFIGKWHCRKHKKGEKNESIKST